MKCHFFWLGGIGTQKAKTMSSFKWNADTSFSKKDNKNRSTTSLFNIKKVVYKRKQPVWPPCRKIMGTFCKIMSSGIPWMFQHLQGWKNQKLWSSSVSGGLVEATLNKGTNQGTWSKGALEEYSQKGKSSGPAIGPHPVEGRCGPIERQNTGNRKPMRM